MPPSVLQGARNGDFGPIVALAFDHANFKIEDMWKTSFMATVAEEGDEEDEEAEASALAGMNVAID
ncbi:hypothetical protein C0995_008927 [Termitomyces sp. Mi166|nr:hypothetical protein C0995_008927 [Termitomyces sp. Mi166\